MKKKQINLSGLKLKKEIISNLNQVSGGSPGDNFFTGMSPCEPVGTNKTECMSFLLVCFSAFCGPKPTLGHCY